MAFVNGGKIVIILLGRIVSDGRFSGSATAFGGCEGEPRGQQRGTRIARAYLGRAGWIQAWDQRTGRRGDGGR